MPEEETLDRARRDAKAGKAPSTQAGEFVREEFEHIREGKHGARSRQAGDCHWPVKSQTRRRQASRTEGERDEGPHAPAGRARCPTRALVEKPAPSRKRSAATLRALKKETRLAASHRALARQAKRAARKRSPAARSQQAKRAARTRRASRGSAGGSK